MIKKLALSKQMESMKGEHENEVENNIPTNRGCVHLKPFQLQTKGGSLEGIFTCCNSKLTVKISLQKSQDIASIINISEKLPTRHTGHG